MTAIRAADTTATRRLCGDPNWTPLAHHRAGSLLPGRARRDQRRRRRACSRVLRSATRFRFTAQSTALPGVERSFTSFSAAENEASLSRIYAGQHFRTDEVAGQTLGSQVADYVLHRLLLPTRPGNSR